MQSQFKSIICPLLRKIYNDVLDEYYEYDQHFDSDLLDWLGEIEKANKKLLNEKEENHMHVLGSRY